MGFDGGNCMRTVCGACCGEEGFEKEGYALSK